MSENLIDILIEQVQEKEHKNWYRYFIKEKIEIK